jgi:DNA-directed RNA polymerase specialized sigma24 family protein
MTKRMQDHELIAWLGDDWTPEQQEKITADWREWESSHPDADEAEGTAILTAICQHHDGVLEVPNLTEARRAAQAGVVVLVTVAGVSESEAARRAGVDRMTVRKWLGKR